MIQIKALAWWATFSVICLSVCAGGPVLSPLTPLELPPFTDHGGKPILNGSVGVSGANAVLVWTESGNEPSVAASQRTNIVSTRIGESKEPVDNFWRTIAPGFYGAQNPRVLASETGFFVLYTGRTATNSPVSFLMTRIDAMGTPAFAPAPLLTNAPTSYRAASNGKTVLVAYETMNAGNLELRFKLVDSNGSSIGSGTLPDAEQRSYAVGCDGTNYLAVWETKTPPHVRAAYIDSNSGSAVTKAPSERKAAIQGIGYGKKGYLVATARSRAGGDDHPPMLHVSEEGELRSEGGHFTYPGSVFSKDGPPVAILSEDEDWVLFTGDLSFTITSTSAGLTIQRGNYPQLHISSGTFALESCVTRFRPGEILVTEYSGYAILSRTGTTEYFGPRIYTTQRDCSLTASPFGYLAAWAQHDNPSNSLRVLRTAKDGTPLDGHSISIPRSASIDYTTCVFDGSDYVLGWRAYTMASDLIESNYIAKISPVGEPDVRITSLTSPDGMSAFRLFAHGNRVYTTYEGQTYQQKYVAGLSEAGTVDAPVMVRADSIVSDGENMYSVLHDSGNVYLIRLDLTAAQPEVSTNNLGPGTLAYGASVRDGFVVWWEDYQYEWHLAYFARGVQQFSTTAPFYPITVAQSSYRLLAAGVADSSSLPPPHYGSFFFQTFDLQTQEIATSKRVLPWYSVLSIACAGKDFFCINEPFPAGSILGSFWITDAPAPAFSEVNASGDSFGASVNLDPNRRYRIESSHDFLTWDLRDVISGVSKYEFVTGGNEKEFVRAILVPE